MAAGPEGEAGVEAQQALFTPQGDRFPLREDEQGFAHLDGFIVRLPVVLPIRVVYDHRFGLDAEGFGHGGDQGLSRFVVRSVELHTGDPRITLFQFFVHVVPVLAVLLQKAFKIGLVLDDEAFRAQLRQPVAEGVDLLACGFKRGFYPTHRRLLLKRSRCWRDLFMLISFPDP